MYVLLLLVVVYCYHRSAVRKYSLPHPCHICERMLGGRGGEGGGGWGGGGGGGGGL